MASMSVSYFSREVDFEELKKLTFRAFRDNPLRKDIPAPRIFVKITSLSTGRDNITIDKLSE